MPLISRMAAYIRIEISFLIAWVQNQHTYKARGIVKKRLGLLKHLLMLAKSLQRLDLRLKIRNALQTVLILT